MILSLCLLLLSLQAPVAVDLDQPHYLGYPAQDAISYQVTLEVLADGSYRGEAEYRFLMLEEAPAIYLDLRADDAWQVAFHDVRAQRQEGDELSVTRGSQAVQLSRPHPYRKGQEVFFSATFSGTPPDGLYRDRNRYGATFVYTDHFSSRCRSWLPLEDANTDRASFTIDLTIPPGWTALGSGAWTQLDEEGRHYRGETKADIPPSLFAFAAGPFARVEEQGDSRLLPHFVFPQDVAAAKEGLQHHAAWMATMEKTFGPYQYAKFTTAQIPTRWGGVEYPGNVWLAQTIYRGRDRGVGTLSHEFAHMWFGDGVGYADWQDAWLSEGFASYFGPWLRASTGGPTLEEAMREVRTMWRRSRRAHALPIRWSGYADPDQMYGAAAPNTYQKGAYVLRMLRATIGDEAFFSGIAAWYQGNLNQAVDSASLEAAMSKAADQDLAWFFAQWLDRPGAPVLKGTLEGETYRIEQLQEGDPFRLQVQVAWTDSEGNKQRALVPMTTAKASLEVGPGAKNLRLDPDAELLYIAAG